MIDPAWEKYVVLADLALVVTLLIWDKFKSTYVFFTAAFVLILLGILPVSEFLGGFANQSIITIFLLIFVTAVIRDNFDLVGLLDRFFGKSDSPSGFVFKLTTAVAGMSSVMNNTPIVAILMPYVYQWGKKHRVSPSKLLIPLSFAAITGGMITVIGTSTNLVLNGFISNSGGETLSYLHFVIPGVLVSLAGIVFLSTVGYRILPDSVSVTEQVQSNIREYLVETRVLPGADMVGKSISEANLRNLDGVFLAQILRGQHLIKSVDPDEVIQGNDRLYFAGDTKEVIELVKNRDGLEWAKTERFSLGTELDVVEAVIPANSILENKTLKDVTFRERYDAAVVAIHRNGERLSGKLGQVKLATGDLLLLTTGKQFKRLSEKDKNIYVVSFISTIDRTLTGKKKVFLALTVTLIALVFSGVISLFSGLVLMLGTGVGLRMINQDKIKKHANLDLLVILGSAITLGGVFISSGAAELVARPFIDLFQPMGVYGLIIGLYLLTFMLTSFVTNVAAVSIVFPLAFQIIADLNLNPPLVYLVIAFGASAAFITPVSYQTNLMVYGPGNYKMRDFFKIGIPFTVLYSVTSLIVLLMTYSIHG